MLSSHVFLGWDVMGCACVYVRSRIHVNLSVCLYMQQSVCKRDSRKAAHVSEGCVHWLSLIWLLDCYSDVGQNGRGWVIGEGKMRRPHFLGKWKVRFIIIVHRIFIWWYRAMIWRWYGEFVWNGRWRGIIWWRWRCISEEHGTGKVLPSGELKFNWPIRHSHVI